MNWPVFSLRRRAGAPPDLWGACPPGLAPANPWPCCGPLQAERPKLGQSQPRWITAARETLHQNESASTGIGDANLGQSLPRSNDESRVWILAAAVSRLA